MKRFICIFILLPLLLTIPVSAYSYAPYSSYEYNQFGEAVEAPVGYSVSNVIDSSSLKLQKPMDSITDTVVRDNKIYALDSGNGRIICLDESYSLIKIYENITVNKDIAEKYKLNSSEETVSFVGAEGFDVGNDGKIYIADTKSNRILIINEDCQLLSVIYRPDEALNDTDAAFAPCEIEVDGDGWIYVASNSITLGVMVFNNNGEFQQFFGANKVLSTTEAIVQFFRDTFMSITQLEFVGQNTPVTIYGMDFNNDGFLYTVSPYSDTEAKVATSGLVKKYNFQGDDILDSSLVFGDIEVGEKKTWFHDIDIDDNGFMNIMDTTRGRIFQYSDDGTLLTVFGTLGDQIGCFSIPSSVENIGDKIIVSDKGKSCLFVFEPTEYGKTIHEAMLLMQNNDLDGSEKIWNELLRQNSNSTLCYKGLGRIYNTKGDYTTAMKYYKLAYAQDEYALALKSQRQIFVEENIVWMVFVTVAIIVIALIGLKALKKYLAVPSGPYSRLEQKNTIQFYALLHPIDAFTQFKYRKLGSYLISTIIVVLWFFARVFEYNCTGFAFNINRESDFNLFTTILVTFGLFIVFVITNWALCTLIDGKGTVRDITATTAYSLIPFIVTRYLIVIMTNVFIPAESVFIQIVSVVGILWTALVLFLGLMSIHEFSVGKTIVSILLTLFGMAVVVFLVVLIYSLMQQMFNFFISVYKEIIFRT